MERYVEIKEDRLSGGIETEIDGRRYFVKAFGRCNDSDVLNAINTMRSLWEEGYPSRGKINYTIEISRKQIWQQKKK